MRKNIMTAAALAAALFMTCGPARALSPETEMLLELLQAKGVLSKEDATGFREALAERMSREGPAGEEPGNDMEGLNQRIEKLEEVAAGGIGIIDDSLQLTGLVEVEAAAAKDYADEDTSDVTLATVEIGLDARLSDWSSAHLLLLYEEGEEDDHLIVDEGTIVLGNAERFPLYLSAGKMYLPFGLYETSMISDPLTLELGEINDSSLLFGFDASGFYGSLYAFNGDINESGEEDEVDGWGASLGYGYQGEGFGLDLGVDWINDIGDTDALGDFLEDDMGTDVVDDYVDGFAAHAFFTMGAFGLITEYVTALDSFPAGEVPFAGGGAEPEALMVEGSFVTEFFSRQTVFALGYQTTDEALALGLPEERYLGAVSMEIFANTSLALEYLHDEDYGVSEGGTGENAHAATVQLAVGF